LSYPAPSGTIGAIGAKRNVQGGDVMPVNDRRVNIRIDSDTYDAYEKVATTFNRTVADFMRESLQSAAPVMHTLGTIIDRAKAGDTEAIEDLYKAFWQMQRGALDLAELTTNAGLAELPKRGDQGGQV
jgi:uncharacterized protein (DUF1778 family)